MRKWNKLLSLLLAMIMAFSLAATGLADGEEGEEAAEPVAAYQVPEDAKDAIVILHTNDVHGAIENYAKVAALKTMYEEAGATCTCWMSAILSRARPMSASPRALPLSS